MEPGTPHLGAEFSVINILLVEDDIADVAWVGRVVAAGRVSASRPLDLIELRQAGTLGEAVQTLEAEPPDAVLLDLNLPDARGLDVVREVERAAPAVPIVVLTTQADEAMGVAAMNAGAEDYLVKGEVDGPHLLRSLRYAVERHRAKQRLSLLDELTGLHNRRGFVALAEQQLKLAQRSGRCCALYFLDVDGLKAVNDTLGHAEGDRMLRAAADVMRRAFRESDVLARIGGDEFAVLAPNLPPEPPQAVLARLARAIRVYNQASTNPWALSISAGVARSDPGAEHTIEHLLSEADREMYGAKRSRRDPGTFGRTQDL